MRTYALLKVKGDMSLMTHLITDRVDVWYSITAGATGTLTLDTCDSSYDTRLAVWADNSGEEEHTMKLDMVRKDSEVAAAR